MSSPVALLASILTDQDARWPAADAPTEREFLAAAAFHGVAPLLAHELTSRSHGCPSSLLCAIQPERAKAATITLIRERELLSVLDRLATSNIQPVLIKGAALAYAHYEQPYLRPSFDIDLFVDREEMDQICRMFEAEGYRRSQQVSGDFVMPQMDYEKKDHRGAWHVYDVHWKLASPQAFAHLLTYRDLAAGAVAIPTLGPHARRPSDVHALFIACVHRVAHHPGVTRLIWLYDIHLIAERLGTAGLARFAALAMEKGVSGICATALAEAHQWFHTRLPEDLVEELQAYSMTANEPSRSFIHSQSKVSILLSDLKLVGGWRARLRLLQQHVFPEPDYMFRLYDSQSRALLPALYTHRFVTGMGKWLANHVSGTGRERVPGTSQAPGPVTVGIPWGKRLLDVSLSGVGLVVSAPIWIAIAAALKLEDAGPVFYTQDRVGEGGRPFTVFKFRSMIPNAEAGVGAIQSGENDPRVTRVGKVLRATAMDELPQLWNIFRGDMSFVGPRALRPSEIETTAEGELVSIDDIPGYRERRRLRPGLTGVAQIYAPRDVARRHKFRFDRVYSRNQGFWLDIRLILISFWITFRGRWEHREGKI
jgi:lipopolysaccharide/colanic/teichoic acid biosynthesis glycosyltransferase